MSSLARKCYESVVEVLKKSGKSIPSWDEMPEEFRAKFEAELNKGLKNLLE